MGGINFACQWVLLRKFINELNGSNMSNDLFWSPIGNLLPSTTELPINREFTPITIAKIIKYILIDAVDKIKF